MSRTSITPEALPTRETVVGCLVRVTEQHPAALSDAFFRVRSSPLLQPHRRSSELGSLGRIV